MRGLMRGHSTGYMPVLLAAALLLAPGAAVAQTPAEAAPAPQAAAPAQAPAPAQSTRPVPPPPRSDAPTEEITVIAPRRGVPDFQEYDEFQRAEFEKIRARFEKPKPVEPRGDDVLSTSVAKGPNQQSDVRKMVREAPRLRDLVE